MSNSDQIRPGVDADIVQARIVRGCDVQTAPQTPGDLQILTGRNNVTGAVGSILVNNRTSSPNTPILALVHGATIAGGETFQIFGGDLADPNGSISGTLGSLYLSNNPAALWQNTNGAATWVQISDVLGGESLNETLAIGNVTGGLNIIVSATDSIQGADVVGGNAGVLNLRGGNATGVLGNGGNVVLTSGTSDSGNTGAVTIRSANASGSGGTGTVTIATGSVGNGAAGAINVSGGTSTASAGGAVNITGGSSLVAGATASGVVTIQGGDTVNGGQGGNVVLLGGDAIFGFSPSLPLNAAGHGGSIVMVAGASNGSVEGGNVLITAGPGGPAGGLGGNILLTPGSGGGVADDGIVEAVGVFQSDNIKRGTADPNVGGVSGNEGDLYQRTLGGRGEVWVNLDGVQWAKLGLSGDFFNSFVRTQFGSVHPTAASGTLNNIGFWDTTNIVSVGGALVSRTTDSFGPTLFIQVPSGSDSWLWRVQNTAGGGLRLEHNFIAAFKFSVDTSPLSVDSISFIGLSSTSSMLGSNAPVGEYVGLQKLSGFPAGASQAWRFISRGAGISAGSQFSLPATEMMTLVIDASVSNVVVFALFDSDGLLLQSRTVDGNATPTAVPAATQNLFPVFGLQNNGDALTMRFYQATAITDGDQAFAGGSGGSIPTLETVLATGNETGASRIILTDWLATFGGVILGEEDAANNGGAGGRVSILGGNTTNGALNGGAVNVLSGSPSVASPSGRTGNAVFGSRDNTNIINNGTTGDVEVSSGDHVGSGASGPVNILSGTTLSGTSGTVTVSSGNSVSGSSGNLVLRTGTGPGVGDITLQGGNALNTAGGSVFILGGDGGTTALSGQGGEISIIAGDPNPILSLNGAPVSLLASAGAGNGNGGLLTVSAGAGGPTGGNGGDVVVSAGDASGGAGGGGDILLNPGAGFGAGTAGVVQVNGDAIVTNDLNVGGKLTVTGLIDPTGLVLNGQASIPTSVEGSDGLIWVDNQGDLNYQSGDGTGYNVSSFISGNSFFRGTATFGAGSLTLNVSFLNDMPDTPIITFSLLAASISTHYFISARSPSGFTVTRNSNADGAVTVMWMAILQ